jgi:hypothetical protein
MTSEQARGILEDYQARVVAVAEAARAWRACVTRSRAEPTRDDLVDATARAYEDFVRAKERYREVEDSGDLYRARSRARRTLAGQHFDWR